MLVLLKLKGNLMILCQSPDVQAIGEDAVTPLHHAARYRREKAKKRDASTDNLEDVSLFFFSFLFF